MVTVCIFGLHSSVIVSWEVILMTMVLERKKLTINEEANYSGGGKELNCAVKWISKLFCAAHAIIKEYNSIQSFSS